MSCKNPEELCNREAILVAVQTLFYLLIGRAFLATETAVCDQFAPPTLMAVVVALFLFGDEAFLLHRVDVSARDEEESSDFP